ncbi:MAG: hypothetical protein R3Y40_03450 [Eubacteriales bacterium]
MKRNRVKLLSGIAILCILICICYFNFLKEEPESILIHDFLDTWTTLDVDEILDGIGSTTVVIGDDSVSEDINDEAIENYELLQERLTEELGEFFTDNGMENFTNVLWIVNEWTNDNEISMKASNIVIENANDDNRFNVEFTLNYYDATSGELIREIPLAMEAIFMDDKLQSFDFTDLNNVDLFAFY